MESTIWIVSGSAEFVVCWPACGNLETTHQRRRTRSSYDSRKKWKTELHFLHTMTSGYFMRPCQIWSFFWVTGPSDSNRQMEISLSNSCHLLPAFLSLHSECRQPAWNFQGWKTCYSRFYAKVSSLLALICSVTGFGHHDPGKFEAICENMWEKFKWGVDFDSRINDSAYFLSRQSPFLYRQLIMAGFCC